MTRTRPRSRPCAGNQRNVMFAARRISRSSSPCFASRARSCCSCPPARPWIRSSTICSRTSSRAISSLTAATPISDLEFIAMLRKPRAIMLLVPAGAPVDSVINDLLAHLQPGDLIIDGGNSYFKDTDVRVRNLAAKGIQFLGVGVSGGEEGARHGPSIMPGGPKEAYERVRPVFEAAAAKVNGDPCVTWLGRGWAGHFVKMVHNGIEYGIMQLIAETYDQMKRGWGLNDDELREVYALWNKGELRSEEHTSE